MLMERGLFFSLSVTVDFGIFRDRETGLPYNGRRLSPALRQDDP